MLTFLLVTDFFPSNSHCGFYYRYFSVFKTMFFSISSRIDRVWMFRIEMCRRTNTFPQERGKERVR